MRLPFDPVAVLLLAASAAGCATAEPSPQLAYCTQLHSHYYRYRSLPPQAQSGPIARAEYAIYQCRQGHYDDSIATLTALIQHHRVAVPPPPKTTAPKPAVDGEPEPYE
jgi:hypothetical protein